MFTAIIVTLLVLATGSLLQSYIQACIRAAELRRLNPTLYIEVLLIDTSSPLRVLDSPSFSHDGCQCDSTATTSGDINHTFDDLQAIKQLLPNTLTFALALLALHPEMQERLREACIKTLDGKMSPEYADVSQLQYSLVLAVMDETLRLFSQAFSHTRETGDAPSVVGNYVVPPKTFIEYSITSVHRDPEIWGKDEAKFKPERFFSLTEKMSLSWVPFAEGPRACVGKKFAQIEFVTLLTMISLRYKIRVPEGTSKDDLLSVKAIFTVKPANPVKLLFSRR